MSNTPDMPSKKSSWMPACLIGCAVMAVVVLAITVAGAYLSYSAFQGSTETYLDIKPVQLPVVAMSEGKKAATVQRFTQFQEAINTGKLPEQLELSGEELNIIAQHALKGINLAGSLYLSIKDDKLLGQVSVPSSALGPLAFLPGAGNKYVNGEVAFAVGLWQGGLNVTMEDMTVNGIPLPPQFLQGFRGQNLAQGIALGQLDSVELKNGKLLVRPKALTQ